MPLISFEYNTRYQFDSCVFTGISGYYSCTAFAFTNCDFHVNVQGSSPFKFAFVNCRFNVTFSLSYNGREMKFTNCDFLQGVQIPEDRDDWVFVGCNIRVVGTPLTINLNSTNARIVFSGCKIHGNIATGLIHQISGRVVFDNCDIRNNSTTVNSNPLRVTSNNNNSLNMTNCKVVSGAVTIRCIETVNPSISILTTVVLLGNEFSSTNIQLAQTVVDNSSVGMVSNTHYVPQFANRFGRAG